MSKTKQQAEDKLYCDNELNEKEEVCNRVAKYSCSQCGCNLCRKCENFYCGECPYCDPPYMQKI